MSTIFNDIQMAFENHLQSMVGVPDIAYPNDGYEPAQGSEYVEAHKMPIASEQASLGASGKDRNFGIFQITVKIPKGDGESLLSDQIADQFKRGTVLTKNGTITRVVSVSVSQGFSSEAWYSVPITISFRSYTGARS